MKKPIYVMLLLLVSYAPLLAQRPGKEDRREKVDALKVGFITKKLDLSSEEAQKFWPVYNKFQDDLEKNRSSLKTLHLDHYGKIDQLTQAESEKVLQEMHQIRSKEVEISQQYTAEFKKILPIQKVVKLHVAEHEFKRELLRQLRESRR
jgi:polysaccharide pyruvyl transferase WcaK-like protein